MVTYECLNCITNLAFYFFLSGYFLSAVLLASPAVADSCLSIDRKLCLAALSTLGVRANEAFALEDSPNGVQAARQAGLFCVAVPNVITSQLPLSHADLLLTSLTDMALADVIAEIERRHTIAEGVESVSH